MEIWFTEDWLRFLHDILVSYYEKTEYPITVGCNPSMISVCTERPQAVVYSKIPFPHLLHKATVLMDTIVNFHPFIDGNKRAGLLATFYVLYWNGYDFAIPENADDFMIDMASGRYSLNEVFMWLESNCRRSIIGVFRNLFCGICATLSNTRSMEWVANRLAPFMFPMYPFAFLEYALIKKRKKRKQRTKILNQQT
jgi:death-on-curing family protein